MNNTIDVTKLGLRYRKPNAKTSLANRINRDDQKEIENKRLLWACFNDWLQLDGKRKEHARFMQYYSGEQWSDLVQDPDKSGKMISEKELFSRMGVTPITHNILQQYIRNVLGQMLSNPYKTIINSRREEDSQAAEMLTNAIQACLEVNENTTIDINHIIALHTIGVAWSKITYTHWDDRNVTDARIDFVNENRISWNQDCEDPRLFDLRRICELHSYTMDELISNFAATTADENTLRELYRSKREDREEQNSTAEQTLLNMEFWGSGSEINKYRVLEVWSKRGRWVLWANDRATFDRPKEYVNNIAEVEVQIAKENSRRLAQGAAAGMDVEAVPLIEYERHYERYWYCQFLTPEGVCLLEMESPYEHQQHPYTFSSMPIIDGVSKPMFSDLIEMQRNINRQRTMLDMLIASSAKNTLFIPEDALEGHSLEEYADEIMKINGVIRFKPKPGINALPQFLQRNAVNIGIFDVLNFDMQQIQQISGLSGAIQGQVAKNNMPASLYAQQAQNTMLNFVLLFNRFNDYCTKRDKKLMRVCLQYYNEPRYLATSGKSYGTTATEYIPEKAKAIADSISFVPSQGMDTPIFRAQINDYLMEMLRGNLIPVETFLQHTTLPFGKQILSEIKSLKEQTPEGGVNMQAVDNIQGIAQQQSDPRAVQLLQQMISGAVPNAPIPQMPAA